MGVYIKDMEMPTGGRILIVFPSGRVLEVSADATQDIFRETQAFPVPPHGRLVDADEMRDEWPINGENEYVYDTNAFLESIDNQPTVISAELGGAEGK